MRSGKGGKKKQYLILPKIWRPKVLGGGRAQCYPPKLGCPHPTQRCRDKTYIIRSVLHDLWGTVEYDIAQLTCMCSTELKALFDPANGREPSLEERIANDKHDKINQI